MAFPRIEIYPRAQQPLTGDEDFVVSQGGVLRKTSTDSVATLAKVGVTEFPGPFAGLALKTPVAVGPTGALIAANAAHPLTDLPFVGFFVGTTTNEVRTSGLWTDLDASFTPGAIYYVAIGGGITATPPAVVGAGVQVIGKAVTSTQLFIQPGIVVISAG